MSTNYYFMKHNNEDHYNKKEVETGRSISQSNTVRTKVTITRTCAWWTKYL